MNNLVTYKGEKYNQIGYKEGKAIFENKQRNKYILAIQEGTGLRVIKTGSNLTTVIK